MLPFLHAALAHYPAFGLQTLSGTDFGTAALSGSVSATYYSTGASSVLYTTAPCTFQAPAHQTLVCTAVAGQGASLTWRITVAGQQSNNFASSAAYLAPAPSSASGAAFACATGSSFTVSGTRFGPANGASGYLVVSYGPTTGTEFTASSCSISTPQTTIT